MPKSHYGSRKYRRGDILRFRRGNNEYSGKVVKIHGRFKLVEVKPLCAGQEMEEVWRVRESAIVAVEEPVLTEREVVALVMLDRVTDGGSRPLSYVEVSDRGGYRIGARTLDSLVRRGLVVATAESVESREHRWSVTAEGHRVAAR